MDTRKKEAALEDFRVSLKIKLAALWTSFMFLYVYVDYFSLYMPGKLEEIMAGRIFVFEISQAFIMTAFGLFSLPVLMIFLCVFLPAKINRWANVLVAALHVPYMLFNLAGEAWAHMIYAAVLEVAILLVIILQAWKWPASETGKSAGQVS